MANSIFLGLGSNLGDRRENISSALRELRQFVNPTKISSLYETAPKDAPDHPQYMNVVFEATTELSPHELLKAVKKLEKKLGRASERDMLPRVIDIDILFYNQNSIRSDVLIIPHARLHLRNFVLVPLCEIAPNYVHPVFDKSIANLKEICEDTSPVTLIEPLS